jgi:hypothetical protein
MKISSTLAVVACAAALAVVVVGTLVSATILGAKRDAEPNLLLRRRFAKMHAEWPAKAATAASLQHHSKLLSAAAAVPPKSFDWMSKGCVRKVPFDLGQCSTIGGAMAYTIEGVQCAQNGNNLTTLSAGQLTDCGEGGCDGDTPDSLVDAMLKLTNGLVATEASYPYTDASGSPSACRRRGWTVGAQLKSYVALPANRTDLMIQSLVSHGPLTVAVDPYTLQNYQAGQIIQGADCTWSVFEHAVTIIGYGERNGVLYWIVRNVWGNFSPDGIVLIQRGVNCIGIEGMPSTVDVY